MRKTFIIITVVALIVSVVGTGVIVFVETSNVTPETTTTESLPSDTNLAP